MARHKGIASLTLVAVLALMCMFTLVRCDMQHAVDQTTFNPSQETQK